MAKNLSLEEAAQKLGIPTDKLVELRSNGEIRGFRAGASWKFPENEIERIADEMAADGGSGLLVTDDDVGGTGGSNNVIGGEGSDLGIGSEKPDEGSGGSDVNLVPSEGDDSDVAVVTSDSELLMESGDKDLMEIDSADLSLESPALTHDSEAIDLSIEPNTGSTGPVTDEELEEISESHPDVLPKEKASQSSQPESDLDFGTLGADDEESSQEVLGGNKPSGDASDNASAGASSLELMDELDDEPKASKSGSRSDDVLGELDMLSSEKESGLISGDNDNLLGDSGSGSGTGSGSGKDSDLEGLDDALDDDDDLIIADDDDDLVISGAGSDISVAGDSGINLMSPSDSGLSLESEPLDLAGSSISALDLGAEASDGSSSGGSGPGSGGGSDASLVDFDGDEEFQLSPSGIGLDEDVDSGSQVIEVEDSEAVAEPVAFDEAEGGLEGDVFGAEEEGEAVAFEEDSEDVAIDETATPVAVGPSVGGYEVPFNIYQVVGLLIIICVMSLSGMVVTDLVRNLWTYTEPSTPVSSLTDSLMGLMGW